MGSPDIFSATLALASVISQNDLLETRLDPNGTGQIQYIGRTIQPGATTSLSVFYIVKLSYDVNGFLNYIQLPNNGPGFIYVWDDRATYF